LEIESDIWLDSGENIHLGQKLKCLATGFSIRQKQQE